MNYSTETNTLYLGDLAQGDRAATPAEIAAWELSRIPAPPTPLQQIRAIEAAKADASAKVIRQALLRGVIDKAFELPEVIAMLQVYTAEEVKAQVISTLADTDPGFKLMWELEQAIEPLRAQIP